MLPRSWTAWSKSMVLSYCYGNQIHYDLICWEMFKNESISKSNCNVNKAFLLCSVIVLGSAKTLARALQLKLAYIYMLLWIVRILMSEHPHIFFKIFYILLEIQSGVANLVMAVTVHCRRQICLIHESKYQTDLFSLLHRACTRIIKCVW